MTKTSNRFSPEVRARAEHMVLAHQADYASQWAALQSIAPKFGCTAEALRKWVRREERDTGQVRPATNLRASRLWNGRTVSFGKRTRSFARRALFSLMRRRAAIGSRPSPKSSTAH